MFHRLIEISIFAHTDAINGFASKQIKNRPKFPWNARQKSTMNYELFVLWLFPSMK